MSKMDGLFKWAVRDLNRPFTEKLLNYSIDKSLMYRAQNKIAVLMIAVNSTELSHCNLKRTGLELVLDKLEKMN